jgi:hypothetical protein
MALRQENANRRSEIGRMVERIKAIRELHSADGESGLFSHRSLFAFTLCEACAAFRQRAAPPNNAPTLTWRCATASACRARWTDRAKIGGVHRVGVTLSRL